MESAMERGVPMSPANALMMHSNQTSVITKSPPLVSLSPQYQIAEIDCIRSPAGSMPLHYEQLDSGALTLVQNPKYQVMEMSDECMFVSGKHYDLQSFYDLSKIKRKPIPVPSENKDDAYWERRRRNNESAKRSREIRRLRELQTTKRIIYLEQENVKLQAEVKFLREELKRLRENELLPYLVRGKSTIK